MDGWMGGLQCTSFRRVLIESYQGARIQAGVHLGLGCIGPCNASHENASIQVL